MGNYERQLQAAARQHDSLCDCCDHGPREAAPADLYDDGWTIGGKHQPVISVAEANRKHREWLAGVRA